MAKKTTAGLMAPNLEGMKPAAIEEVEQAAEALKEARYNRIDLQAEEGKAEERLIEVMEKHGVQQYEVGNKVANLVTESKKKIKFTSAKTTEKEGTSEK